MSQLASFKLAMKAERRDVKSVDRDHAIFERSLVSCIAVLRNDQVVKVYLIKNIMMLHCSCGLSFC